MQIPIKIAVTGLALAATLACAGAKTDRPVVTNGDGTASASPSGTEMAKEGKSLVRLVNAIPAKRGIDVTGGDRTVFTNIGYKDVTPYAEIRNNMVSFRLHPTGMDSTLANNSEAMTDGYRYTIVALPGKKGEPQMTVLRDDVVADSGKARIRVVNAAPDIGSIDVAMQGQKDPIFSGVNYGSEAGDKDITPVDGTLEIRSDLRTRKPLLLKNMHFEAGKAYTIVLAGWGTGGIDAITFDDAQARNNLTMGN